jgi:alkanesulfonate monooxygenase SsuD/methylene tetrahydromethanopterin reductase-like flavin-dependent oxidoreductase (luciferase family)
MKFGVFYEIQLPTPWEPGDQARMFRETLEHVVLADRLGIDHMWAVEHHFLEDHALSSAPESWLPAAAALTRNIRIGHGIACLPPGFSHPARVAERIATLDLVSNGRVEFGTGESASRMELEAFGVDPNTKRRAYLEALEQICNMMAMSPYPGFEGEFFRMPCRNILPKPIQTPHPPVWVAGKPDVAANLGIGCLGFNVMSGAMARAAVALYYKILAESCVPISRSINPNIAVLANFHVHPNAKVARDRGEHLKFFGYSIAKYYLQGKVRPGLSNGWDEFLAIKDGFPQLGGDNPTSAIGTPDEVRRHLRELQAAGVDQVMLMHQGGRMPHEWNCESLELFAREIMPEFRDDEDARVTKKIRSLEPVIEAAMKRKVWMKDLGDDIPVVEPYGSASFIPKEGDYSGVSQDTRGALGLAGKT